MTAFAKLRQFLSGKKDLQRARSQWPVLIGNHYEVMDFDQELASRAAIGDVIEVYDAGKKRVIGHVKRIAMDTWFQWKFEPLQGETCPL